MKNFAERAVFGLIGLWFFIALSRSVVQGTRIIQEFARGSVPYFPEIVACTPTKDLPMEQTYIAQYRRLGVMCQN